MVNVKWKGNASYYVSLNSYFYKRQGEEDVLPLFLEFKSKKRGKERRR